MSDPTGTPKSHPHKQQIMVVGRNTQTLGTTPSRWIPSNMKWYRNLSKNQLGGVIFGCTNVTMKECLAKQLFGLPAAHFPYVRNIEPGLPLFLFDYSDRKLHGIYEAASSGKMGIDCFAWTEGGSSKTNYPAQVQIRLRLQCEPLTEVQFKPIIIDNYYGQVKFRFELDHTQASKLMSKLFSQAVAPGTFTTQQPSKWAAVVKRETLVNNVLNSHDSVGSSTTSNGSVLLNENNRFDEKDLMYMKLKELALGYEIPDALMGDINMEHEETSGGDLTASERGTGESLSDSPDYPSIIAQLCMDMEELKNFQQWQSQKMESMEIKLVEAEKQIHRLENRRVNLESISNTSMGFSGDETRLESPDEVQFNINESILIVGGHDGVSWSSTLRAFSPSHDVLRSLKPMSSVRAYASVTSFDGELYVLGGGTGSTWYNTVESYNVANDEWTQHPCLSKGKGSLAGAAVDGKLFAVGGGNGADCFSEVEMLDPNIGRWIPARSLLEKRFAVAAAELNGALYAVGGYDGCDYLKSAERFDPREHAWTRIKSMNSKRGCHSLVVLNEKLYALGGFDGTSMVPSVEIYEPRLETWMAGDPMNEARGYATASGFEDSIYVIGGVRANEDIVDVVECYKEGQGWEATNLSAVGKICFASATVMK